MIDDCLLCKINQKMGEKAHLPTENGFSDNNKSENSDLPENSDSEDSEDLDETSMTSEEFQQLDHQLDALNSALDDIEQKNDSIHAQLLLLLQSNREIRQQMKESNAMETEDAQGQSQ